MGTQTQYLWMFISVLVLREAHIFHLGVAGQQARSSSWDLERLEDSLVTERDTDIERGIKCHKSQCFRQRLFICGVA